MNAPRLFALIAIALAGIALLLVAYAWLPVMMARWVR